jgi:hypothetical protein
MIHSERLLIGEVELLGLSCLYGESQGGPYLGTRASNYFGVLPCHILVRTYVCIQMFIFTCMNACGSHISFREWFLETHTL